jgi:hypothetical protein
VSLAARAGRVNAEGSVSVAGKESHGP